ncbi:MAG: type II toxin-antitoxin system VapC family toxin [Candidatus Dormibacteria bacterium]
MAETAWLIEDRLGPQAEVAFLRSITRGELSRVDLVESDWERCVELVERYADLGLGLVDASLIAVAERLGVATLATLNHRDFTVVRTPATSTPSPCSPENKPTSPGSFSTLSQR